MFQGHCLAQLQNEPLVRCTMYGATWSLRCTPMLHWSQHADSLNSSGTQPGARQNTSAPTGHLKSHPQGLFPEKAGTPGPFLFSLSHPASCRLLPFALPPATWHTSGGLSPSDAPQSTLFPQPGSPFPTQSWTPRTGASIQDRHLHIPEVYLCNTQQGPDTCC